MTASTLGIGMAVRADLADAQDCAGCYGKRWAIELA